MIIQSTNVILDDGLISFVLFFSCNQKEKERTTTITISHMCI